MSPAGTRSEPAAGTAELDLAGWFGQGLARAPHGVALRVGAAEWTYQQLHRTALCWAGTLRAGSATPPRTVAVLAARTLECYAGILAAMYAGAVAVPLTPDFPPERTAAVLTAARPDAIIADRRGVSQLPAGGSTVLLPDPAVTGPAGSRVLRPDPDAALAEPYRAAPADIAYLLFTSGSTGRPKGVPVSHGNMHHFLWYNHDRYQLSPADVLSQTFDPSFDLVMFDLFMAWGAGATLVRTPAAAFIALPEFIRREGITLWFSVPSAIDLVRRRRGLTAASMPSLRWALFCGEPLTRRDAEDWQRAAPGARLENLYGPTELTIACSAHRWSPQRSPQRCVADVVPIGSVYPGLAWLLLDERGRPTTGEGELCVSGPQTFPGYLDPADDAGRFLAHAGRRWYRTGDRVRELGDGELAFLGRVDHQIKIRGYRIELAEIEAALHALPGVHRAVVVPVAHRRTRELAVFYTGTPVPAATATAALARLLPEFMVPRWFWHTPAFPLNANRKIDRRELAARAQQLLDDPARVPTA